MGSLELLVLGSGGPFVQPQRASSGYVITVDGRAAQVGSLLLTHVMPELDGERDDAEKLVRASYRGPVTLGA